MIAQLVKLSLVHYLVALLFYEITGISPVICIIIAGVCLAVYTILGGIDAVIWTDVIQTVILVSGGIICLGVIIHLLPGGLSQIFSVASEHSKLSLSEYINGELRPTGWGLSLGRKTGTMLFLLGLTNWLTEFSSGQTTIQRYYTTKNIHEARKAMWVMAGFCLPVWALYMFLGTALFAFFTVFPNAMATEMLDGTRKAEQILPYFIVNYLPKGVIGLVLAAALAAAMSTLSAIINSVSTTFVVDVYKRYLIPSKTDKHYLRVAILMASFISVMMIAGAIVLVNIKTNTLQDVANILTSLLGGGLLAIYLIGFLTNIGDWRCVLVGLICTMSFTAWTICAERNVLPARLDANFEIYYTTMVGNIIMFATTVLASFVFPRKQPLAGDLTIWTQKTQSPVLSASQV
jgi:SSS family solute:Na+ symporter